MNKLTIVGIVILVLATSLITIYTNSGKNAPDSVASTQGVKLLPYATGATAEEVVSPGDMYLSSSDTIYFITEIRRSFNKKVFLVVSIKHMNDYKDYDSFISAPFIETKIYKMAGFLKNKQKLSNDEIKQFFEQYKKSIE